MKKIILCGGCFWCTEAVFQLLHGVTKVQSVYTGGATVNPTYAQVCSGDTGHAEGILVEYDEREISTRDLLAVFFGSHDPTTMNRQGADTGTQYRSAIFYQDDDQRIEAERLISEIEGGDKGSVVTEVTPLGVYYSAESYHQDYYENNKDTNRYCEIIINPKLEKVQKEFADLLKNNNEHK